jgi:hypothetical protein
MVTSYWDYHFALLPRLITFAADASGDLLAILWLNSEAFGFALAA